jgi:hypothetical protein
MLLLLVFSTAQAERFNLVVVKILVAFNVVINDSCQFNSVIIFRDSFSLQFCVLLFFNFSHPFLLLTNYFFYYSSPLLDPRSFLFF